MPIYVSKGGGGGGADADAIHDNVAGEISAIAEKTAPVAADMLLTEDSAAANAKKMVKISNIPLDVSAYARNAATQSIGNASWTAVTSLTTETWDTHGMHDVSANQDRMTAPYGGVYLVVAKLYWAVNAVGERKMRILQSGGEGSIVDDLLQISASNDSIQTRGTVFRFEAGDYAYLQAYQTSGGALNLNDGCGLTMTRIASLQDDI